MKKDTHPDNYRLVVFKDTSCDYAFLTKSTVETKETIKWDDGKEYPLCKIEISSKSHPFFTGKQNLVDTAGRIEKFNQKYGRKQNNDSINGPIYCEETQIEPFLYYEKISTIDNNETIYTRWWAGSD